MTSLFEPGSRLGERWFTADLHLGHRNVIDLCARPFIDLNEMHATIIENWNSLVDPRDTVFILGDVAMGSLNDSLEIIPRLHGNKILIAGNHDRCFAGNAEGKKLDDAERRYRDAGFTQVVTSRNYLRWQRPVIIPLHEHTVALSHFPITGEARDGEDRFSGYRPMIRPGSKVAAVLHGHVHNAWTVRRDGVVPQINMGVDVWSFEPIHESLVEALIRTPQSPCACERLSGEHEVGAPGCASNDHPSSSSGAAS